MERKILIKKLVAEGMTEKTLVNLNDKQLNLLANRMLNEQVTTMAPSKPSFKVGPKGGSVPPSPKGYSIRKDPTDPTSTILQPQESEIKETLKGKQKKLDKNHNGKIDAQDFKILKGQKNQSVEEKKKPSAGLSAKKKSEVVKAAKGGKDIGKPGKGFKEVEKKAKESGAKNPKAVAAAAMWKNVPRESKLKENNAVQNWLMKLVESQYHPLTSKGEIMELLQSKLKNKKQLKEFNMGAAAPDVAPPKPDTDTPTKPGDNPSIGRPSITPSPGPKPGVKNIKSKKLPDFFTAAAIQSAAAPDVAPPKPDTDTPTKPGEPKPSIGRPSITPSPGPKPGVKNIK
jgi:hypothetical protein